MSPDYKKLRGNIWAFWLTFFALWSACIEWVESAIFARKQADAEDAAAGYRPLQEVEDELRAEHAGDLLIVAMAIALGGAWLAAWVYG